MTCCTLKAVTKTANIHFISVETARSFGGQTVKLQPPGAFRRADSTSQAPRGLFWERRSFCQASARKSFFRTAEYRVTCEKNNGIADSSACCLRSRALLAGSAAFDIAPFTIQWAAPHIDSEDQCRHTETVRDKDTVACNPPDAKTCGDRNNTPDGNSSHTLAECWPGVVHYSDSTDRPAEQHNCRRNHSPDSRTRAQEPDTKR